MLQYLKRQLTDLGIDNFYDADFVFNEIYFDKIEGTTWNEERIIKQLDLLNFSLNAEVIKKIEIFGNKRVGDETIKIYGKLKKEKNIVKKI